MEQQNQPSSAFARTREAPNRNPGRLKLDFQLPNYTIFPISMALAGENLFR
jgi:hypothetical protein